jgi:hypothetical protein
MAISHQTDARQENLCEAHDPAVLIVDFGALTLLYLDVRRGNDAVLHIILSILSKVGPYLYDHKLAPPILGPLILSLPPGFWGLGKPLLRPAETLPEVLLLSSVCVFSEHSLHDLLPVYRV